MTKKTRRTRRVRNLLLIVSMMLVVAMASVGVTVAWLTDSSDTIVNTFTSSDIDITLTETNAIGEGTTKTNSYKMVPGQTITKDPKVTVAANSESCWLFVKLDKTDNFDDFMTYTVDSNWTVLPSVAGVYYKQVAASTNPQEFGVISGNTVTVNNGVTKAQMNALTATTYPKLTVTAYAVQQASFTSAEAAWEEAAKLVNAQ